MRAGVRQHWVAARWALRGVLGRYLDKEPARVELRIGEHGKPRVAEAGTSLRFNLSHSGELALVAVAWAFEVGVDIERIAPRDDLLALSRRTLAPEEAARIKALRSEKRLAAFHAAWTRREAVAKCLGAGLRAPLPQTTVAVSNFEAKSGYAAAVAVAEQVVPTLRHFTLHRISVSAPAS